MTDARTEILTRIRSALGPDGGAVATPVPREYRAAGEHAPGSDVVLDLLVDRLEDYKAHVHRTTAAGLPDLLARMLAERAAERGRDAARGSVVVPSGLDPAWVTGLGRVAVRTDSPEAPLSAAELDGTDAVVTAARVAVAETGTIVLDGGPDQGRRAISLVPDTHVCVVRTDQVVQTVPEAVRLLGTDPARPLTWISGPSATSDIELDRVEGVHGPRTLHVVLVS
ncbi:LUD domain-containing protein [Promicromonospora xylanilytica]